MKANKKMVELTKEIFRATLPGNKIVVELKKVDGGVEFISIEDDEFTIAYGEYIQETKSPFTKKIKTDKMKGWVCEYAKCIPANREEPEDVDISFWKGSTSFVAIISAIAEKYFYDKLSDVMEYAMYKEEKA